MIEWKPKKRQCKAPGCRCRFVAHRPIEWWCSPECGAAVAAAKVQKARARKAAVERAETRRRRAAMERPRDLLPKVQAAFNRFVRERDNGLPCISCGRSELQVQQQDVGGTWDCGHYRSVGANPELRFEPLNAHRQCKRCNRDRSGNVVEYRIRLCVRIGAQAVEWLEGPHEPKRYSVDELRALLRQFNADARRLVKAREQRGMVGCD